MTSPFKTIGIIGGTGKIGSALVKALGDHYRLRLLVRSPERLISPTENSVIIKGDARNMESIRELLTGCDLLINVIGQPGGEKPVFSQVALNIVNAANEVGMKRYIVIAGLGLETPSDKKQFLTKFITKAMHLLIPSIANDKKKEYKLITGSPLGWTFIRIPKVVLTHKRIGFKVCETDCPNLKINLADLVDFIKDQIESKEYLRKAPFVSS